MINPKVQVNKLCFCWYFKNIWVNNELDLYYCIPTFIGDWYSSVKLFRGNDPDKLIPIGTYHDICTADLKPISE